MAKPVPVAFSVGRPKFPDIYKDVKLENLVTEDTWFLFHVQGMEDREKHMWLSENIRLGMKTLTLKQLNLMSKN